MEVDPCSQPNSSECIRCGACADACPTKAIYLGFKKQTKNVPNEDVLKEYVLKSDVPNEALPNADIKEIEKKD